MTAYLLLAACAAGQYPPPAPPGWPSYPPAGYVVYRPPLPPPSWQPYPMYPAAYQTPGGYTMTANPVPQPPQGLIIPVGSCSSGDCGTSGCASSCCDDGCGRRHRLRGCLGHQRDCELPCGHPDYKAVSDCCKAPRCGLLSRLRECFHRDCCKPSLRDRLRNCFHRDDCCEPAPTCCKPKDDCNTCCRPGLHDRLRAFFHRRKNADCCCQDACASPAQPESIKPPKEMPKEKEPAGVLAPSPRVAPVPVINDVPF